MRTVSFYVIVLLLGRLGPSADAQDTEAYRLPPKAIADAVDAPSPPQVSISPDQAWLLQLEYDAYPPVRQLAAPEIQVAGLGINPLNNAPAGIRGATGLRLKGLTGDSLSRGVERLPARLAATFVSWSPDGKKIAFCQHEEKQVELWVIDVATARARRVAPLSLNPVFSESPYQWLPDGKTLLCRVIPPGRGPAPAEPAVAAGPVVQQHAGRETPSRTYQGLLKNAHDEARFDYYATSQLVLAGLDGRVKKLGLTGIYPEVNLSPDGRYALLERIHRPYSYLVKAHRFPTEVSVLDLRTRAVVPVRDVPLRETNFTGRDAVQAAPRNFAWRPDLPATLYWVEARDGGDPKTVVPVRDQVLVLAAPFRGQPVPVCRTGTRLERVLWANDTAAIAVERWWADRRVTWTYFNPATGQLLDTLFVFSAENRYSHPGEPLKHPNHLGRPVVLLRPDGTIFLAGEGASPGGDRPFLDQYNLRTKARSRRWQSQPPCYETCIRLMDPDGKRILTRRESKYDNPNYHLRNLETRDSTQVTFFPNPLQGLSKPGRRELTYQRADGLSLTGYVYTPEGYRPEMGPLPALLWAYPVDFKEKEAAQQVYGSPYAFVGLRHFAALFATQGYAVLDAPFPIVAENGKNANDTFIEQLIANAEAVIGAGVRAGLVDSGRVAVGGHSYGAVMAASLLTHSRLFKAGIALSGAYNRTLTPFGFQREYRSYWQAPEFYNRVSPFQQADRMKFPLLLVHGAADDNPGTHAMQSERYYNALKGLGATVRYVSLPHEGHNYQARESVLHVYWEACRWLDTYVKKNVTALEK